MKRSVKYCLAVLGVVLIMLAVGIVTWIDGGKVTEGTYKIIGCENYPEAYIRVEGNKLQFYNIDLNSIYQDSQLKTYESMKESGVEFNATEEQLEIISDLNALFVLNAYEIVYEEQKDNGEGAFTYIYFCNLTEYPFGLVLEYNSLHKTLQINNPVQQLVFQRQ